MELTGKDLQYKEVNESRYKNEIERIIQKYQVSFKLSLTCLLSFFL